MSMQTPTYRTRVGAGYACRAEVETSHVERRRKNQRKKLNTDWKDEIDETEHLLSSEKNKEHLEESIEQAEEIEKTFQGSEGFLEEQVNLGFKEIEIEEKEDLLDKATKQNEIIQRNEFLKNNTKK